MMVGVVVVLMLAILNSFSYYSTNDLDILARACAREIEIETLPGAPATILVERTRGSGNRIHKTRRNAPTAADEFRFQNTSTSSSSSSSTTVNSATNYANFERCRLLQTSCRMLWPVTIINNYYFLTDGNPRLNFFCDFHWTTDEQLHQNAKRLSGSKLNSNLSPPNHKTHEMSLYFADRVSGRCWARTWLHPRFFTIFWSKNLELQRTI